MNEYDVVYKTHIRLKDFLIKECQPLSEPHCFLHRFMSKMTSLFASKNKHCTYLI